MDIQGISGTGGKLLLLLLLLLRGFGGFLKDFFSLGALLLGREVQGTERW